MAAPHLALAILFSIMAVHNTYELWVHAGDSFWRSALHLLLALSAIVLVVIEIRRGRTAAKDPR